MRLVVGMQRQGQATCRALLHLTRSQFGILHIQRPIIPVEPRTDGQIAALRVLISAQGRARNSGLEVQTEASINRGSFGITNERIAAVMRDRLCLSHAVNLGNPWIWLIFGDSNSSAGCRGNLHPLQKRFSVTSSSLGDDRITKNEPDPPILNIYGM